jgi:hypothetical protein
MATPDTLAHLMDWAFDRISAELTRTPLKGRHTVRAAICPCGLNPLLAFFITAEEVLVEALFLEDLPCQALPSKAREMALAHLRDCVRRVGVREIEAFCAVCRQRERLEQLAPSAITTENLSPPSCPQTTRPELG